MGAASFDAVLATPVGWAWASAGRSGVRVRLLCVLGGFRRAPHILFSLVLTGGNNCPSLPPRGGVEENGFLGAPDCPIARCEHSGERPRQTD